MPALLAEAYGPDASRRVHVIADARVAKLHPDLVAACGSEHPPLTVVPGERSKSLAVAGRLLSSLAHRSADRGSVIVAVGGGVVGDLAGFVASLYQRGIDVVQVPTTLLAQVDASVGGKTAVNLPEGKNLAGTFHQPRFVVVDPEPLGTLGRRDRNAGLAEVAKTALLAGGSFWREVRRLGPSLAGPSDVERLVGRAIAFKAKVVAADERESGLRRVLNLGHTLAHALEAATGFRHYRHGEAVAVGLVFAAELSWRRVGLSRAEADAITSVASPLTFRPPARSVRLSGLAPLLLRDKKTRSGVTSWVLLEAPGTPVIDAGVSEKDLEDAWDRLCRLGLVGPVR